MSRKVNKFLYSLVVVFTIIVDNSFASRYLVQQSREYVIPNPFVRQVRYYRGNPVYSTQRIQYPHSQPLYIGNYAEPLYQPGYRTALIHNYPDTGYGQDDYLPPADYDDGPYPGRFYDSYAPPDTHYGPPQPESPPEEPTTTVAPVMATPCTCHPLTPSQPLPEGAPEDMHLPPELVYTTETEETTTEAVTTTTEPTTTTVATTTTTEKPKNTYLPPAPPTEAPVPSNTYLPAAVEPRIPMMMIQGPTPLPDEEEHGYIYPVPHPVFPPEEPETTTTEEPAPPEVEKPEPVAPVAPPQFVGGYQPIFLIPFYPQSGFSFYGNPLQMQLPNYPQIIQAPVEQNGGQGVVISIPSKTYLPPKE